MLRPTFLSFETAKRALSSSQLGLDTVGHNVSNVSTPGYTRQRIDQVSISSSGYKAKYASYSVQFPGQGSEVVAISQIRDPYLDKRYRTEAATAGELGVKNDGLQKLNTIFDEIKTTGSIAKLNEFLVQLDKLITTADSPEQATVLRNKAKDLALILNRNAVDIEYAVEQQRSEMQADLDVINTILEQIAMLNIKIKEDNFYNNPANELNDQRNLLIDQLSELIDIEIKHTPVKISSDLTISHLSIEIKNSGDLFQGIPPVKLLDSGDYVNLKMTVDNDGSVSVNLMDGMSGYPIKHPNSSGTDDITGYLYVGALKGHLDMLNGIGVYATQSGENSFMGFPYYQQALDEYTQHFANTLNDLNAVKVWNSVTGSYDSISKPLFCTNDTSSVITAKNLAVTKEWQTNAGYISTAKKNNALYTVNDSGIPRFTLKEDGSPVTAFASTDVVGIDADGYLLDSGGNRLTYTDASFNVHEAHIDDFHRAITTPTGPYVEGNLAPDEYLPGAAENDVLNAMKIALTSSHSFANGFHGTHQEFLVSYLADMGLGLQLNTSMLEASLTVLGGLADSRDGISAVNIDEEAVNMLTYQNYYNAAARYMTVLDEALGTVIQGMGVVGR